MNQNVTKQYCVVLADVVDSQKIEDREAFRERLDTAISEANQRYQDSMRAEFDVLKGIDEFGAVLNSVKPIADIQKIFSRTLYPEQFRMAAVTDKIDVNKGASDISQMDGPAFARADIVLFELENNELKFQLSGNSEYIDTLVSDQINLLEIIRSEWGDTTMDVVRQYDKSKSQSEIAEEANISAQTVSYHLNKSNVEQVLGVERRLSKILENYDQIN
ncbi:SatD family protein [Halorubrum trapanicum]|uniref:SatD family protein n=1 Tax=Halorubrum trapanicum TaxID=29284 RepID=UPI000BBAFAAF|nr:SatD family protein [Halorubrum trapanicum]